MRAKAHHIRANVTACRCRVQDWKQLRSALGMTQAQLAELLRVDARSIQRWEAEAPQHACPLPVVELLLETWLDEPELAARLAAAGYANPFGEPVAA
jgi:DNA-binding transcriptional regulator YiaG